MAKKIAPLLHGRGEIHPKPSFRRATSSAAKNFCGHYEKRNI